MDTNEMQKQVLRADKEVLSQLIEDCREDNVKRVLKLPGVVYENE